MQTFEIEGQANQTPFTGDSGQAAQGELAKPQDFFDGAEDWLNRAFAQRIQLAPASRLQSMPHGRHRRWLVLQWRRLGEAIG